MSDPYAPTATGMRAKSRRIRRKVLIAVSAAVAVLGLGGLAAGVYFVGRDTSIGDMLSPDMTVTGTIELPLEDMLNWGTACSGREPLDYLEIGAPVAVADASGKVVGLGQIDKAKEVNTRCVLSFSIDDVPKDSEFYSVTVAGRKAGQYTAAEMKQPLRLTVE